MLNHICISNYYYYYCYYMNFNDTLTKSSQTMTTKPSWVLTSITFSSSVPSWLSTQKRCEQAEFSTLTTVYCSILETCATKYHNQNQFSFVLILNRERKKFIISCSLKKSQLTLLIAVLNSVNASTCRKIHTKPEAEMISTEYRGLTS